MIRAVAAISAAAVADLVVLLRADGWSGGGALLAAAYLALSSAGAGFFAVRRPALAGALAVLAGAALAGIVQYAPRASSDPDLGVLLGFEVQLLVALAPYAIVGGLAGLAAGALRARLAGVAR